MGRDATTRISRMVTEKTKKLIMSRWLSMSCSRMKYPSMKNEIFFFKNSGLSIIRLYAYANINKIRHEKISNISLYLFFLRQYCKVLF